MSSENESIGFRIADRHVKGANSALAREIDAAIRDAVKPYLDLLCVIHRDGGHYINQHGEAKALADAIKTVYEMRDGIRDAQERQREACAVALAKVKIQLNSSSGRVATHDFHGLADVVRALPLVGDEATSPSDTPSPA